MIKKKHSIGWILVGMLVACGSSSGAVQPTTGPTVWYSKAVALDEQKKYDEALEWYRRATEDAPQNGYYQGRLGQHYLLRLHDWDKSIPCYRRALGLNVKGTWVPTQLSKALCWQAEMAVADGRWENAAQSYAEAASTARQYKILEKNLAYYDEMARLAKNGQAGLGLVTPQFTHNVILVLVREVFASGPITVRERMTDAEAALARKSLAFVQNWVYAASSGNIRIQAEIVEWSQPVSALTVSSANSFQFNPEVASIRMEEIIAAKTDSTDTFIFVWGSQKYQTSHGGAGYYRIDANKYRIWRGLIKIPSMRILANGPYLMAHEFFHVIENMFSINPRHGFAAENRGQFPTWKGSSEFGFYHWALGNYIPELLKQEKWRAEGWRHFNFRLKYAPRGL